MEVTRKKIKKEPYLVTDEMYEGEEIGINLNTLNETNTIKKLEVSCLPISFNKTSFVDRRNAINFTSEIKNIDDKIVVRTTVLYPEQKNEIVDKTIDDKVFAEQLIQTCITDKKDIKNIDSYRELFDLTVNEVKEKALEEDILIKTPEFTGYKLYIYSENNMLLGVANRLMLKNNNYYTLGEYIGKPIEDNPNDMIYIDMCVNKDTTLRFTGVSVDETNKQSIGYWRLNFNNASLQRVKDTYQDIRFNYLKDLNLPLYEPGLSLDDYAAKLLMSNSDKSIKEFYNKNKPNSNKVININKYLIW